MKKIVFLLSCLFVIGKVKAQVLYVTNSSCADIEYVIFASESGGACGPDDDKSVIMTISAGNSISYDFAGGTAASGFHWVSQANPGDPSSNVTGGNFNFYKADVGDPCWSGTGSIGTCLMRQGLDLDGTTVFTDMGGGNTCGNPTVSAFSPSVGCSSCSICYPCCDPYPQYICASCTGVNGIGVSLTKSGSDWYLNITP